MKEKVLYKVRVVFYSALVISLVLNTAVYFWNLYLKKNNNTVSLCVNADIIETSVFNDTSSVTAADEYLKLFRENKVSSILFDKISITELMQDGLTTIKNGHELIDDFRSQGIINPYIYQQLKHRDIKPDYSYIFIHNQELFVKFLPALQSRLKNYKVEVFQDTKFQYDGDVSNNYIIQVNTDKSKYINLRLFYPDNLINYFYSNNFNIALLDPDFEDLQQVYDFHIIAVIAEHNMETLGEFKRISPKMLKIALEDNKYFALKYPAKRKYLPVTETMIMREKILYKKFFSSYYDMLIYKPAVKSREKLAADLENIGEFASENNIKIEREENIKTFNFIQLHKLLALINLVLIVSFHIILLFKTEKLLFLGYTGITAAFTLYMSKMNFMSSVFVIWSMGAIQIVAIQLFFSIISNKKIENLIKGLILVFAFYYLSVISTGQYMYSLLGIPALAKNIIIIFQLLSFAFGLYIYRKKFENQFIYNFIQIMMLITFVVIIFRDDMGLSNLFINFYDKIISNILIVLK